MTPTINRGAVREVWFAPTDDPDDKNSFLIRDDAYSEREVTLGKTIRLGEPVDLGPFGQWRQTNWSGGQDQETWRDEAMFELSSCDVSERRGSLKLWNGWTGCYGYCEPNGRIISHLLPAAAGLGDNNPLLFAERQRRPSPGGDGSGDYRLWKFDPTTTTTTLIHTFDNEINAIAAVGDVSGGSIGLHLIGLRDGRLFLYNQSTGSVDLDHAAFSSLTNPALAIGYHSICAFNNGTYFTADSRLYKRTTTSTTPGSNEYTHVATLPEVRSCNSAVVWNNRLWLLCLMTSGRSGLFVSDGYTVQLAFTLPGNLSGIDLCAHYGSLYVRGIANHYGGVTNNVRTKVFRFNGSSLTLLWEDDETSVDYETCGGMISHDRHLVWPKFGSTAMGREVGVWLYDAEEDAIYMGPTRVMDAASPQAWVTALTNWNNNITAAFYDGGTYTATTNQDQKLVAYVNKSLRPRSVKLDGTSTVDTDSIQDTTNASVFNNRGFATPSGISTTKSQLLLSSAYDGGLAGEQKIWVKGYVRCRVPQNTYVTISLIHDDNPTAHLVQTITYNGSAGWRDVRFSALCATHGIHETSTRVRYRVALFNSAPLTSPNSTPEVDVVGFDFLPAAEPRLQYHLRVVVEDGGLRVNGDPNPLEDREAIEVKLREYLRSGSILFWRPRADGEVPDIPGQNVKMTDYIHQSFRLDSVSEEIGGEISFNLLQVA